MQENLGPLTAYRQKVAAGEIQPDSAQELAAERLQEMWRRLINYDPQPAQQKPRFSLFGRKRNPDQPVEGNHGLYLAGEVGRGKSMLMDLFFDLAQVKRKRRIHFHRFMQDTHARLHAMKKEMKGGDDPIPPLAREIAEKSALLCFDEFQINDIADAMILGRLFQALFELSVVIVTTSNTVPDDLFKGQPGRDAFLPFIGLIKKFMDVLVLDGGRDYRRDRLAGLRTWHTPLGAAARAALDEAFSRLAGGDQVKPRQLTVQGRQLDIAVAAEGLARFEYAALCERALGPGDYLAIATHFHTVIIDNIPRLTADEFDRARRFITLVDALYEHKVKVIVSAETTPDDIFTEGLGSKAFERTASRLMEMQSARYLELQHLT